LLALSGQTHELHSAIAVVLDGKIMLETVSVARTEIIDAHFCSDQAEKTGYDIWHQRSEAILSDSRREL
jgi:predicted house-cleaning NTP pyrophosphatase (Maf/HAM1 superfamily)